MDATVPLNLALVFTAGAYGIHRGAAHADRITHILMPVVLTLMMLVTLVLVARLNGAKNLSRNRGPPPSEQVRPGGRWPWREVAVAHETASPHTDR